MSFVKGETKIFVPKREEKVDARTVPASVGSRAFDGSDDLMSRRCQGTPSEFESLRKRSLDVFPWLPQLDVLASLSRHIRFSHRRDRFCNRRTCTSATTFQRECATTFVCSSKAIHPDTSEKCATLGKLFHQVCFDDPADAQPRPAVCLGRMTRIVLLKNERRFSCVLDSHMSLVNVFDLVADEHEVHDVLDELRHLNLLSDAMEILKSNGASDAKRVSSSDLPSSSPPPPKPKTFTPRDTRNRNVPAADEAMRRGKESLRRKETIKI